MVDLVRRAVTKFRGKLLNRGPRHAAAWVWGRTYEHFREWSLGIETIRCDEWKESYGDSQYHVYEPILYACVDRALSSLRVRPGRDVFLDFGSGKGRVITVAATYPFQRVIGVEMLPELNELARANVARARARGKLRCQNVELITVDATQFEVPGDVTVVFLFNPFKGSVLRAVQERIRQSLLATPRELTLIYMNPLTDENLFADCEWLRERGHLPTASFDAFRFIVYGSRPNSPPAT